MILNNLCEHNMNMRIAMKKFMIKLLQGERGYIINEVFKYKK